MHLESLPRLSLEDKHHRVAFKELSVDYCDIFPANTTATGRRGHGGSGR